MTSFPDVFNELNVYFFACRDPESFVRGSPTLTKFSFFIVNEGRENTAGHHQPASKRFAGVPMMAQH